jgi:DNA-binding NtrC family response regulator
MDVSERTILILDDDAPHTMHLQGILFQEGYRETFIFNDNQAAERWLARHTPEVAIIKPRLRDGSCRGIVSTLAKRSVPFIVYSELRPGTDSWLADGQWINKPCIPHIMLSAVRFAVAMRQVQTVANSLSREAQASTVPRMSGRKEHSNDIIVTAAIQS